MYPGHLIDFCCLDIYSLVGVWLFRPRTRWNAQVNNKDGKPNFCCWQPILNFIQFLGSPVITLGFRELPILLDIYLSLFSKLFSRRRYGMTKRPNLVIRIKPQRKDLHHASTWHPGYIWRAMWEDQKGTVCGVEFTWTLPSPKSVPCCGCQFTGLQGFGGYMSQTSLLFQEGGYHARLEWLFPWAPCFSRSWLSTSQLCFICCSFFDRYLSNCLAGTVYGWCSSLPCISQSRPIPMNQAGTWHCHRAGIRCSGC